MTFLLNTTREKVFIVTGDRDWTDRQMNLAVILDDFLFFDVFLFLTPASNWQKQISLVAGQYHSARRHFIVFFDDFFLTDRPLREFTLTTNEQGISGFEHEDIFGELGTR